MGEGKVRGFKWYGQRWLDSNVVPEPLQKVGDRDLSFEQPIYFSKVQDPLDWHCLFYPNKESDVAKGMKNGMKNNEVVVDVSKVWVDGVQFVAQPERQGTNVGAGFVDSIHRLMEAKGVGAFSDSQFEERVGELLALEAKVDHERHVAAHAQLRHGLLNPENVVIKEGSNPAPRKGFTGSTALDNAKPTIAGKIENLQRAIDAGMIPSAGAAKQDMAFPVPQSPTPHEQFDIAVNSADLWSHRRHPTCDGFVFDNEVTGETVFIAYERLREMAKLLIAPRERTERGEAMRRRLLQAVGHASTLFHGDDGVFDSKRAIKIADDLMVELELGPGLDSLPGIGRTLERERRPVSEPHAHLDEDLLAEDA